MNKITINYTTTKPQGYIAGSLFNQADIRQRLYEGEELKENTNISWYNPIEADCNNKEKLPTADDIFNMDTEKVLKSNYIVADISTNDVGVYQEVAIAWTVNYIHYLAEQGYSLQDILTYLPKKELYAHLSDIRKSTAHRYEGNYIPWGTNQFGLACCEQIGNVYDNFEDILKEMTNAE